MVLPSLRFRNWGTIPRLLPVPLGCVGRFIGCFGPNDTVATMSPAADKASLQLQFQIQFSSLFFASVANYR